ncbi:membrane protein [Clostridium novyi A str. 4570]|nr:membrane protein [Clostridium novyi A str. 4570]
MMKVSNITKGGILIALTLIFIYLSSIIPTNKLSLMTITSFIIILSIISLGVKTGLLVFVASSILSFFIVSPKEIVFTYILFFGLYGFVKYYIEHFNNVPLELFLKLIYFNVSMFILFYLYKTLFIGDFSSYKMYFPIYTIIIFGEIIFFIFDYVLTLFVSYYNKHFASKF